MVTECLSDIRKYIEVASIKVEKLDQLETKGLKGMGARVRWASGEFNEPKILVETLAALIENLYTIIPTPPLYDRTANLPLGAVVAARQSTTPMSKIGL
jgi:hypothetical protein